MNRKTFAALFAGALGAVALAGSAVADTAQSKALVDAAKSRGEVGEQFDGYLGFVTSVSDPALRAAVAEINAGRAQLYRQAAARNNVTPEAAGVSAFKTLVEAKIAPGEYFKTPEGDWRKK
jgi:uncharacterized protein YdbL (DUF1318 family)